MTGMGSLIVTNVRRNMARSLLTVIGMGLAALIMTASLTLSEGYPAAAYGPYRDYCGGDVLVFADKVWVRGPDVNRSEPGSWQFKLATTDMPGPWRFFQPGLATRGMVAPQGAPAVFYRQSQVDELEDTLLARGDVVAVRPYFAVPVTRATFAVSAMPAAGPPPPGGSDQPAIQYGWNDSYLRGWRGSTLWASLDGFVVDGRALGAADEGLPVCLVDVDRAKLGRASGGLLPPVVPAVGGTISVALPSIAVTETGQIHIDHTSPHVVELRVVGHYSVPSRTASWIDPAAGGDSGAAPPETEQLYLTSPEIIVPWTTAAGILAEMSGGSVDMWATAVAVELDGLARVESAVTEINNEHPDYCAVSVPRLASTANARWLPEPLYRVPESEWQGAQAVAQLSEPVEISQAFNVIFFAVAALLAAANGIILVLERQKEIGILKALGAYGRDVIVMILGEIVLLSSIGALVGFVLAESMAAWNLISNRAGWLVIVTSVGFDLVRVLGLTVAFAVVFGLAPAMRTTAMTAMEVLRRE